MKPPPSPTPSLRLITPSTSPAPDSPLVKSPHPPALNPRLMRLPTSPAPIPHVAKFPGSPALSPHLVKPATSPTPHLQLTKLPHHSPALNPHLIKPSALPPQNPHLVRPPASLTPNSSPSKPRLSPALPRPDIVAPTQSQVRQERVTYVLQRLCDDLSRLPSAPLGLATTYQEYFSRVHLSARGAHWIADGHKAARSKFGELFDICFGVNEWARRSYQGAYEEYCVGVSEREKLRFRMALWEEWIRLECLPCFHGDRPWTRPKHSEALNLVMNQYLKTPEVHLVPKTLII